MTNRFRGNAQLTLKRELIRALFLFVSNCLVLCCCAQASVYYVAKNGSDSNSGSASAPWLTIGHAALEATGGQHRLCGSWNLQRERVVRQLGNRLGSDRLQRTGCGHCGRDKRGLLYHA